MLFYFLNLIVTFRQPGLTPYVANAMLLTKGDIDSLVNKLLSDKSKHREVGADSKLQNALMSRINDPLKYLS